MNPVQNSSAERFFNRLETEQDAMVMQYIKQSTPSDRAYVARPRSNHYRCNKRLDHMMSTSGSILRASSPKSAQASIPRMSSPKLAPGSILASGRASPRRSAKTAGTHNKRPVSVAANNIYPIGTR